MRHDFCDGFQAPKIHLEYNCANTFRNLRRKLCSSFVRQPCNEKAQALRQNFDLPKRSVITCDTRSRKQSLGSTIRVAFTSVFVLMVTHNKTAKSCVHWDSEQQVTLTGPRSTFLLLHLSTWSKSLSENVTGSQIVKTFSIFYRT
jgi:hypothetical protein